MTRAGHRRAIPAPKGSLRRSCLLA
jgi:hypothetical protein